MENNLRCSSFAWIALRHCVHRFGWFHPPPSPLRSRGASLFGSAAWLPSGGSQAAQAVALPSGGSASQRAALRPRRCREGAASRGIFLLRADSGPSGPLLVTFAESPLPGEDLYSLDMEELNEGEKDFYTAL